MRYSYQNVMKFEICRQILEKYKKRNIMKISPVGAESLHADRQTDRQTDMTKPIMVFRNFSNAHKMSTAAFQYLGRIIHKYLNLH